MLTARGGNDDDGGLADDGVVWLRRVVMGTTPFASGSGGDLYNAKLDGRDCAIKMLPVSSAKRTAFNIRALRNEIRLLSQLRHANVVEMIGVLPEEEGVTSLVMELCHTTLLARISNANNGVIITPAMRDKYAMEICQALAFVHSQGFMHRDVKPSNVLLAQRRSEDGRVVETVKLCDFGLACALRPSSSPARRPNREEERKEFTGETGSYRFMAPEVFAHRPFYDEKIDVYSFALVLFFIHAGGLPFAHEREPVNIAKRALRGERPSTSHIKDEMAVRIMQAAWCAQPTQRPSMHDILLRFQLRQRQEQPSPPQASSRLAGLWKAAMDLVVRRRKSAGASSLSTSGASG